MKQDRADIVDSIKTLDEAKQLILHLLEIQEDIFNILNYELRTPLMLIKGYAELAQREDMTKEHPHFLKIIIHHTERMASLIEAVRNNTHTEWLWHRESLLEYYPLESVDLHPILMESVSQIQKRIDLEDDMRAHQAGADKKQEIEKLAKQSVNFKFNIDDNLPTVQLNPLVLEHIMSDVVWFVTECVNDDNFIISSFDEKWVKVTFGYSTNYFPGHLIDDYKQFETASSSREFSWDSLLLYNIWRRLKAYGGELSVNIEGNRDTNMPSKTEVAISFLK
jgi:hypothetical protein